jgi:hypothetical protein
MKKPAPVKEIEFHPDAWERFEHAVRTVAKSPPQHRVAKPLEDKAKKREASKPAPRSRSRQKINK